MNKDILLTEKWLRDKHLILKRSDREHPNIVYVRDLLPLHIKDDSFCFKWEINGIEQNTRIETIDQLRSLYEALTHRVFNGDD